MKLLDSICIILYLLWVGVMSFLCAVFILSVAGYL